MEHYEGDLGVFDYDENVWEITITKDKKDFLHLKKGYKGKISLPKGIKSCYGMFYNRDLIGCWFEDFDTSNVKDMPFMFHMCKIPEGFSLGDKFDTSNVKDMSAMFRECKLPERFSLGDKFDTSNVKDMGYMFTTCKLPEGFSLGDKFDTGNVKFMDGMFYGSEMLEGFTLGDKFDTSNVTDMKDMFHKCEIPKGFTLGDKFDTSSVKDMSKMFMACKLPEGFSLGDRFDTSNVKNMEGMFRGSEWQDNYEKPRAPFPKGFSLGDKFDTSNVENMMYMFRYCKFPKGFSLGDKFDTSNVKVIFGMFMTCELPEGFSLGDKFDTSNVKEADGSGDNIFSDTRIYVGNDGFIRFERIYRGTSIKALQRYQQDLKEIKNAKIVLSKFKDKSLGNWSIGFSEIDQKVYKAITLLMQKGEIYITLLYRCDGLDPEMSGAYNFTEDNCGYVFYKKSDLIQYNLKPLDYSKVSKFSLSNARLSVASEGSCYIRKETYNVDKIVQQCIDKELFNNMSTDGIQLIVGMGWDGDIKLYTAEGVGI